MIEAARDSTKKLNLQRVSFAVKDIETYSSEKISEKYEVVYSNAALHWVDDHTVIQRILENLVAPGGFLAVQMPDTRRQPSHTLMKEAAVNCGFGDAVSDVRIPRMHHEYEWYYDLLQPCCQHIDMWSTEAVQQLPTAGSIHPVLQYTSSTGLRPIVAAVRGASNDADAAEALFLGEYTRLLTTHYTERRNCNGEDMITLFPFRRFFFVARKK